MRQFRAILVDSLYESIDHKALLVLLVLSGLLIVFCASLSFKTETPEQVLAQQSNTLAALGRGGGFWNLMTAFADCKVTDIKPVERSENWQPALQGGYAVTLTFGSTEAIDSIVRRWRAFKAVADAHGGREPPREPWNAAPDTTPVPPEERVHFLEARFERMGYGHVEVHTLGENPPAYRVAVRTDFPHELTGASRMRLLFGAIDVPLAQSSVAETVVRIQLLMANTFAGFIGVLVAVLVCSGFVPSMLQKGTLDLVLARPVGRGRLLLYKYLGGLWFVLIMSTVLIGGCWLAITIRTGYVNPWFLASILTITGTFAVVYSVSLLIGVLARSGTVAALLAIFVWGLSSTLIAIRDGIQMLYFGQMAPHWLRTSIDVLYDIAPKTLDLMTLNTLFLSRSHLSEAAYQRAFGSRMPPVDWTWSLGTTAAFTVVMLGLAMWVFRRRDY